MSIIQLAGIALLTSVSVLLLRELKGGLAPTVRLAAAIFLFGAAILLYLPVIARIRTLFALAEGRELATPVLRAVGVALIAELSAMLCRDMGEGTVAEGVLLFGRMEILLLALPLVDELLRIAGELLQ
ncbi:MAG: stage III sporulation AC/AD family protein [Clostridia bacterium]|nr:stage III sporulation AC/AD family protein [Clostridia bacterium]